MTIEQLSVFVENKHGKLVEAVETIAKADVDLRALSLADTTDFGILRIIVDKPVKAMNALQEEGFLVRTSEVIPISVSDKPGALAKALRVLADAGVNVEYTYAFVAHSNSDAYVILRVDDNTAAAKALTDGGITLLTSDDIQKM